MFRDFGRKWRGLFLRLFVVGSVVVLTMSYWERDVHALATTRDGCDWPVGWPIEFEDVRTSCRTIDFMAGSQEKIYEIVFDDRDLFERVWHAAQRVRSNGGRLRLMRTSPNREFGLTSDKKPTLRFYVPLGGIAWGPLSESERKRDEQALIDEGKAMRTDGPFPDCVRTPEGNLPEYVCSVLNKDGRLEWDVGNRDFMFCGFLHRARIDLELVVDGTVIDLNRIPLPKDGQIEDKRFDPQP